MAFFAISRAHLLGCFPSVVQLHGSTVFVDGIAVLVAESSVVGDGLNGVVERRGKLGEVAAGLRGQLLRFFRTQPAASIRQEVAGFAESQIRLVGIGGTAQEVRDLLYPSSSGVPSQGDFLSRYQRALTKASNTGNVLPDDVIDLSGEILQQQNTFTTMASGTNGFEERRERHESTRTRELIPTLQ